MRQLHRRARVAFTLCLVAIPAGLAAHLALTDIFHGEPDPQLEWFVLQLSALIVLAALVTALRVLHEVLRIAGEKASTNRAV